MCGRFAQRPILDFGLPSLIDLAPALAEIPPGYNLAPTQPASVIRDRATGRQVSRLAWGLLPSWAQAKKLQGSTFNARIETVATKNAFRAAFKKRRSLVPMAGYYEWSISDVDGKKDPWFIHADSPLWAAGLCEEEAPCCPMTTREPSPSSPATAAACRPISTTVCLSGSTLANSMRGSPLSRRTRWPCSLRPRCPPWRRIASAEP